MWLIFFFQNTNVNWGILGLYEMIGDLERFDFSKVRRGRA